ncbi:unnamed protein product, partial [Nesidiocoris tenuis]
WHSYKLGGEETENCRSIDSRERIHGLKRSCQRSATFEKSGRPSRNSTKYSRN